MRVREAIRDAIAEEMHLDKRVFVLGEEVAQYDGAYKVTKGLLQEFGDKRIIDTPISEYGFMGIALGASMYGLRPVVEFMNACFSFQAIDHIISTASKNLYMTGGKISNAIVMRAPNGWSNGIAAQHSHDMSAIYSGTPGLKVVAPWSSQDAKALMKSAIQDPNPVVYLESERMYGQDFELDASEEYADLARAKIEKEGTDITVVAYSSSVSIAMEAAEKLAGKIDVEVVNLRSLLPIDYETIVQSLSKTNNIIVVQMCSAPCSIASEVIRMVCKHGFDYLDSEPIDISAQETPVPYAQSLEQLHFPNSDILADQIQQTLYR